MGQSQHQDSEQDQEPALQTQATPGQLSAAISEFEFALSQLEAQIQRADHHRWSSIAQPSKREMALEAENEILKQKQKEMRIRLDATIARLDRLMGHQGEQAVGQNDGLIAELVDKA